MLSLLAEELLILSSFNCRNGCLEVVVVASIFVLVALLGVCLDVTGGFCGFFCDLGAMNFKFKVYFLIFTMFAHRLSKNLSTSINKIFSRFCATPVNFMGNLMQANKEVTAIISMGTLVGALYYFQIKHLVGSLN